MIKIIIISTAIILFVVTIKLIVSKIESSRIIAKQTRFKNRESILVEDIYEKYFSNFDLNKRSFIENWRKAASLLKLDPTLLRPDDGFEKELSPVKGSMASDETEELDFMLIDYCKKKGIKRKDLNTPKTFGEFIIIVTEKRNDCIG